MSYPLTVFKTIVNGTKSDAIDVNQATDAITAIEEFLDVLDLSALSILVDPGGTVEQEATLEASLAGPFQPFFDPTGTYLYVLGTSLGNTTWGCFSRNPLNGSLTPTSGPGTLPPNPGQGCMNPAGTRIYVPETTGDKIHVYAASAGSLAYVGYQTTGSQPVNCICDLAGNNLYVACLAGTSLQRFAISGGGSTLTYADQTTSFTTTDVLKWNDAGTLLFCCRDTESKIAIFSGPGALTEQTPFSLSAGRYAMAISGDNLYVSTNLLGGNNRIEHYSGANSGTLVLVSRYESPDGTVTGMHLLNHELFAVAGIHTVTQWRIAKNDPLENPGSEIVGSLSRKTAIAGYTSGYNPTPSPDGRHLYAVDYSTGYLNSYAIRDGRFVCHPGYAIEDAPTLTELGADDILHGTLGRMRGGTGIDGTTTGGSGCVLVQDNFGGVFEIKPLAGENIDWSAHAVGAALPVATAAGTYGAGEQTMLQACYDRIAAMDQAFKSIGAIQI